MARKLLNKDQRRYIRQNYKTMSVQDMAKQLKCDIRDVNDALREMELLDEGPVHKALPLRKLHKIDLLWGIPCFLLPTIIYAMTMCRTLYVGDSGEFSAQGSVLGIAHPPGYPMWVLMLKIAVFLFQPFLEHQAARGAFLCALVAGTTAYFLYILILKLSHYRTIAVFGAGMFAFCYHFWSQALFSEVFVLNVLFTIVTMLLMLLWSETQEPRYFLAMYLVTAMAMAHHNLFLVMPLLYSYFIVCTLFKKWGFKQEFIYLIVYGIIGLVMYGIAFVLANQVSFLLIREPLPPGDTFGAKFMLTFLTFVPYTLALYWWHKRDRIVLYAFLLFILGFCMYMYLPMRILSKPMMSWGYPHNMGDLYNHISRRQYGPLSQIPRAWPFGLNHPLSILGPWDIVKEQFCEYWIFFFRQFGSSWDHYTNPVLKHFNHQLAPFFHGWRLWLLGLWTVSWFSMFLLGTWRLLRQNGKYFMLTLMAFLFYGPGMLAVLNYQTTNHTLYIVARFLIPSYLMATIWIAFGGQQIMEWFKYGFQWKGLPPIPDLEKVEQTNLNIPQKESKIYPVVLRWAGCGLFLLLPIIPERLNHWHQDLSKNSVAYDFGLNILNSITPDGKIFIIGDNPTFAIAYLSYVEKKFPDQQIFDEGENLFVMIHDFGDMKFRTSPNEHTRLKNIGRARVTMTSPTPVFYMSIQPTTPQQNEDPNEYKDYPGFDKVRQLPSGIVYQAVRPGEKEPEYEATLKKMKNLDPFFYEMSTDYYTRELVSNYHFLIGRAYYELKNNPAFSPEKREEFRKKAIEEFEKVSETGWDLDNMHINLANIYRMEGLTDKSLYEYDKAIETQPRKAISYFQMADLLRSLNQQEKAIEKLKVGVTLGVYDQDANDPTAYYMLGSMELEQANKLRGTKQAAELSAADQFKYNKLMYEAEDYLNTSLKINPNNVGSYQSLGEVYYLKQDYENAVAMWNQAILINPKFYPALMDLALYYRNNAHDMNRAQEFYTRALQQMQAAGVNPPGQIVNQAPPPQPGPTKQ